MRRFLRILLHSAFCVFCFVAGCALLQIVQLTAEAAWRFGPTSIGWWIGQTADAGHLILQNLFDPVISGMLLIVVVLFAIAATWFMDDP